MEYKRGDIVYVDIPYATGSEMLKDRPGVIVSNDAHNFTSGVVCVVFLTGSREPDGHIHVDVQSAQSVRHGPSVALCEQIYTVDKSRLGKRMARCTNEEMHNIDNGILLHLALGEGRYRGPQAPGPARQEEPQAARPAHRLGRVELLETDLRAATAELEVYKRLYNELLDRFVRGGAA